MTVHFRETASAIFRWHTFCSKTIIKKNQHCLQYFNVLFFSRKSWTVERNLLHLVKRILIFYKAIHLLPVRCPLLCGSSNSQPSLCTSLSSQSCFSSVSSHVLHDIFPNLCSHLGHFPLNSLFRTFLESLFLFKLKTFQKPSYWIVWPTPYTYILLLFINLPTKVFIFHYYGYVFKVISNLFSKPVTYGLLSPT